MKKVMVHAVTKLNLGDDLFLKILFERYPRFDFVLYMDKKYKKYYLTYNNVSVSVSSNLFLRSINFFMRKLGSRVYCQSVIAKKCDVSIHIGGSIFQQKDNWKIQLKNREQFLFDNQPYFVLGANFGSFNEKEFLEEYTKLFSKYTDICFRDNYSYSLFNELSNVRQAADIVFSLKSDVPIKQDNKVVISVIKPSFRPYLLKEDMVYYEKIKEISMNFINDGYNVVLMSFCKAEGDEEAINSIKNLIPETYHEHLLVHRYYGDLNKALMEISTSNVVIATRFHAMILGWLYNKPTIPIAYNEKMLNVMNDVNYDGEFINFKNLHELTPSYYLKYNDINVVDIDNQIKDAENHFIVLDELLK